MTEPNVPLTPVQPDPKPASQVVTQPAPVVSPPPPSQPKQRRGCVTCLIVTLIILLLFMCCCSCAGFGALSMAGAKGQPGTILKPSKAAGSKKAGTSLEYPTGLSAKAAEAAINLNWNSVSGTDAAGVKVYRSDKPDKGFAEVAELKAVDAAFTDENVKKGVTYYYVLTAVSKAGAESGNSNSVFATIETPPIVPAGINSWADVKAKAEADEEYLRILTKVTGLKMSDVDNLVGKEKSGINLKTNVLKGSVITNTMEDYRIVPNFVLPNDRECLTDEAGVPHVMVKCGNPMKRQSPVTTPMVVIQQTQLVVTAVINIMPVSITNVIINAAQTANGIVVTVLPDGILIDMGPTFSPYPPDVYVDPVDFGDDLYDPDAQIELEEGQQWIEEGKLLVSANPPDPGPNESVTMIIGILPAKAGVEITYNMSGTDGYSLSGTVATDANGEISFVIAGGAEGVVDTINVSVPSEGLEGSVQYTF